LIFAAIAATSARAEPTFTYDRELAWWVVNSLELASRYTGSETKRIPHRTYVRCYKSTTAFEAPLLRKQIAAQDARHVIAYYAGGGEIHVRTETCTRAREFVSGRITLRSAEAISTLLHETLHRQGIRNEHVTECYANDAVKYAGWLARWNQLTADDAKTWRASERYGERARQLAFAASRRQVAYGYYTPMPECLNRVGTLSWADYLK
jgi:hypothetical protein